MKGIRKLFLGLILLTLFGVAFKDEAKADPVDPSDITGLTATAPTSWGSSSGNVLVTFTPADGAFPTSGTVYSSSDPTTYKEAVINVRKPGTPGAVIGSVTIRFLNDTGKAALTVAGGTETPLPLSGNSVSNLPISITKSSVYEALGTGSSVALPITCNASTTSLGTATVTATPITFDSKYVENGQAGTYPAGMSADITVTSGGTSYNVGSTYHFLPGDVKTFGQGVKPGGGYALDGWYINGSAESGMPSLTDYTIPNSATTIGVYYKKNLSGLTLSDIPSGGVKVAANHSSLTTRTYSLGTDYTRDNILRVRLGGFQIGDKTLFTTGGTFSFNTDRTGSPLTVEMTDGQVYEFPITVVDATATISIPDKTVYKGETLTITPTTAGMDPDSISYSPSSVANVYSSTVSGLNMVVTGLGAGPTTTVTASAHYDNIEGLSATERTKTTTFKLSAKEAAPIEFTKNIFVNKGTDVTVKLKDFLKYETDTQTITVGNNSGGLISLTPSSGANAISTYIISGLSKGTKEKGVTVTPGTTGKNEANVTVYPEPTISVETSSTSSSTATTTTYSYAVTMPKGVYHDEPSKWVDDLKKAILIFKSSSSDGKTKEVVLDSLEKNDDYSKKQTKKIDVKTITGYLRDICKNDEETVSVWACAVNGEGNNDSKIKTDSKDLKVYKIALDTNGNKTSYTVNGDTVYDYFYKIDGVEYTVIAKSSTGTGKVDKKNSVNADNATESTGTATIKLGSSGSGVLGERKIKVAFSASNTPADDSSGSSDGYDDQPKTGESKADIWILWTVLFISIIGAGFMIWKRFGLVRAIAEADEQVAAAEYEEKVTAAKKEKEDKIKMLKDLRNL